MSKQCNPLLKDTYPFKNDYIAITAVLTTPIHDNMSCDEDDDISQNNQWLNLTIVHPDQQIWMKLNDDIFVSVKEENWQKKFYLRTDYGTSSSSCGC